MARVEEGAYAKYKSGQLQTLNQASDEARSRRIEDRPTRGECCSKVLTGLRASFLPPRVFNVAAFEASRVFLEGLDVTSATGFRLKRVDETLNG